MIDTTHMGQALQKIFGETAAEVARETKFVQRESQMTGSKFLQTWVMGFLQHPKASLTMLCQGNYSAIHTGVDECSTATYGGSFVPPAAETEQNWSVIAVETLHIGAEK